MEGNYKGINFKSLNFNDFVDKFELKNSQFNYIGNNNNFYIIGDENSNNLVTDSIKKMFDKWDIKVLKDNYIQISHIEYDNENGWEIDFIKLNDDTDFDVETLNDNEQFNDLIMYILITLNVSLTDIVKDIINNVLTVIYVNKIPDFNSVILDENLLELHSTKTSIIEIMGMDDSHKYKLNDGISLIYIDGNDKRISFTEMLGMNDFNDKNLLILMSKFKA